MSGLFTEAKGVKSAVFRTHKAKVASLQTQSWICPGPPEHFECHIKAAERDLVISGADLLGRMARCSVFVVCTSIS
jgi:hypothetical protein